MDSPAFSFLPVILVAFFIIQFILLSVIWGLRDRIRQIQKRLQETQDQQLLEDFETELGAKERRIKYRAPTNLQARITVSGKSTNTKINNISKTGALIELEGIPLVMGESYPFELLLPSGKDVRAKVSVVRVLADASHYGVCFQDLSLDSKKWITDYISKTAEQELLEN